MLKVVKIGGNVVDNSEKLDRFLQDFASLEGPKVLVHGGGKIATTIGKALGITANHVGRIANQYGLKKPEYGEWVLDVAAHSAKTVRTFRYYESVIPIIKDKLREEGRL